jgi:hypothetical protein
MASTPSPTIGVGTRVLNCMPRGAWRQARGVRTSGKWVSFFCVCDLNLGVHHWPYNVNNGPVSTDRSGSVLSGSSLKRVSSSECFLSKRRSLPRMNGGSI